MTKKEIKALVEAKIAGQGTNVDAGSVLPSILNAIIDGDASTVEVDDFEEFDETTSYTTGDIVRNDGKLYKFTADKNPGAWDATKVSQTNVYSLLSAAAISPTLVINDFLTAETGLSSAEFEGRYGFGIDSWDKNKALLSRSAGDESRIYAVQSYYKEESQNQSVLKVTGYTIEYDGESNTYDITAN